MLKNIVFTTVFLSLTFQAHSLKVETYDNFTRFIFEPKDIQAKVGTLNNSYWHYPGYEPKNGCVADTVSIFLMKKSDLSGYVTIKSTSYAWINTPRDIAITELFQVKAFSQFSGSNQEVQSAPFYLSELKDIKTLYYENNSSYIQAKTENSEFINSKLVFNNNQGALGKINFCIANIFPKTELYINSIIIDAIN